MALFNYATKEITLKIVYYGPGLSGKTTNLQHLHAVLNPETKGKLLSLSTESDRTLFFDFLPIELGKIRDFSIRFQLYTVPGQVRYNATRKVVLKGADAVVFVADSQKEMKDQNIESFDNMMENLVSNNIDPDTIPIILQYNKRDLKNLLSIEELNQDLNKNNAHEVLEATAINGGGVEEAFKRITKLVLKDISRKHKIEIQPVESKKEAPVSPKPEPEAVPEQKKQEVRPEPQKIELKADSSSIEPVFEVDTFEIELEDELEIFPDHETAAIEVLPEAEPLEPAYEPELMSGSAHASIGEPKEDIAALKPVVEEPAAAAAADSWPERLQEKPEEEEEEVLISGDESPKIDLQPFPVEKIENLADELARVTGTLSRISDAIAMLQKTVSGLNEEVGVMKKDIALFREKPADEPGIKEMAELKELRRAQKEILDLIRYVSDTVGSMKEKKSWFRL
ncbi:MAG: GTPase domain-containing protein [Nitrospirae bacterium]|nr:GTPase domain-containing protein [Nitrospirota bacterium]